MRKPAVATKARKWSLRETAGALAGKERAKHLEFFYANKKSHVLLVSM